MSKINSIHTEDLNGTITNVSDYNFSMLKAKHLIWFHDGFWRYDEKDYIKVEKIIHNNEQRND